MGPDLETWCTAACRKREPGQTRTVNDKIEDYIHNNAWAQHSLLFIVIAGTCEPVPCLSISVPARCLFIKTFRNFAQLGSPSSGLASAGLVRSHTK